jgi:hypothetical protein
MISAGTSAVKRPVDGSKGGAQKHSLTTATALSARPPAASSAMLAFPSRRKRTILALHGFGSRPEVFQFQLAPLLKSVREKYERQEGKDGAELEVIWLEAPVWLPIGKPGKRALVAQVCRPS